MMRLTKSELEIMEVLWAADEPLCRADIIARSQDKTWKDSSVHILLNSTPAISEEAYFAGNLFNRKDSAQLSRLFAGLVNSDGVTPALLDELEGMIQTRRNELNK